MSFNKNAFIITLIVISSFILKLIILLNSSFTFNSDDAIYAEIARFWTQGKLNLIFHPTWQPLFPALSTLFYLLTNNWEVSLRLVSSVAGSLLIIPLFLLIKKTISNLHATLFAIYFFFFTPIIEASITPLSDMLSTTLIVSSIIAIFLGLYQKNHKLFLLGTFFNGLTFLTRSEGVMFFGLTFIYLSLYFLIQLIKKRILIKSALANLILFVAIFLLTILPYAITTGIQMGQWTLSQKFSAQIQQEHAFKLNSRGTTWSQEIVSVKSPNYHSDYFKNGLQYVAKNIFWLTEWYGQKLAGWKTVLLNNLPAWGLIFIVLGTFYLIKRSGIWASGYILFILLTAVFLSIFSTPIWDIRYLLWTLPILIFLFYYGFYATTSVIFKSKINFIFPLIVLFLLPSFSPKYLINPQEVATNFTRKYYKEEIKEAGIWIKENNQHSNPKIVMRHEGVEFYADGTTIYLPQNLSYQESINYAKKNKADFIIIWPDELNSKDGLFVLTDHRINGFGLKKVYQYPFNDPKIIIYKLI
ncbi:glycosyltransferase family 39 protein [Candidatus Microgenomates bacterium]|nr:glycosyltransferase family 39 protein [Candidatus Microgenomates bacterium]